MTSVAIEENPDNSPLDKARGAVTGWQTQLDEHADTIARAAAKLAQAQADVATCEAAVAEADRDRQEIEAQLETARATLAQLEA